MCRPADGLCAKCHKPLPEEWRRSNLCTDTDVCQPCAEATLRIAMNRPDARLWADNWKERIWALQETARSYLGYSKAHKKQMHN